MHSRLRVLMTKNKEHIDAAKQLFVSAQKAGNIGEAFAKIANAVLDVPYFQENHVPGKYEGMAVSAYLYWLFLAELNSAFFDDGEITFVSVCERGEIRFSMMFFDDKFKVQKQMEDPNFILNKRIDEEIDTFNSRNEIWKRCGSENEPIINRADYQINIHRNPHLFCEEFVSFANREPF